MNIDLSKNKIVEVNTAKATLLSKRNQATLVKTGEGCLFKFSKFFLQKRMKSLFLKKNIICCSCF